MNGTLGMNQPGAINSGTLGALVRQPGAFRSGSLGAAPYRQPGAFNSGSLGYNQPGAFRSGSLGEYFAAAASGLGFTEASAYRSGILGEYFSPGYNMNGLGRTGCGCSSAPPVSGLGTTVRMLGRRGGRSMRGLGRALGTFSLDLDMMVGLAIGAGGLWLAMGKKCGI